MCCVLIVMGIVEMVLNVKVCGTHKGCRYMIHRHVFVAAALVAATRRFPKQTFSLEYF